MAALLALLPSPSDLSSDDDDGIATTRSTLCALFFSLVRARVLAACARAFVDTHTHIVIWEAPALLCLWDARARCALRALRC